MTEKRTQAGRSEATTAKLVAAAAELFGAEGYQSVSTDAIAAKSGMTKGALYHHFDGKPALFLAVFTETHRALAARIESEAAQAADGWEALRTGLFAFLRECLDPAVRQILVVDGPLVLGRDTARDVENRHVGARLLGALARLRAAGVLAPGDDATRARLLLGALCEAALLISASAQPAQTLRMVGREIDLMINGYHADHPLPPTRRAR